MNASSFPAMSWKESLLPRLNARPSTKNTSLPASSLIVKSSPQAKIFCFMM
jgi:hypothetical protein